MMLHFSKLYVIDPRFSMLSSRQAFLVVVERYNTSKDSIKNRPFNGGKMKSELVLSSGDTLSEWKTLMCVMGYLSFHIYSS